MVQCWTGIIGWPHGSQKSLILKLVNEEIPVFFVCVFFFFLLMTCSIRQLLFCHTVSLSRFCLFGCVFRKLLDCGYSSVFSGNWCRLDIFKLLKFLGALLPGMAIDLHCIPVSSNRGADF